MSRLMIPFDVRIMLTTGSNEDYKRLAATTPKYDTLKINSLGSEIESKPFSNNTPPTKGAHLHFLLPQFLTHGVQKQDTFEYPALPNRWLVTRIWKSKTPKNKESLKTRSWIVESDYIGSNNTASIAIPMPKPDTRFLRLGRCYELGADVADGEYLPHLSAVCCGDPSFAAYYPSCKSVFGFYDSLQDIDSAELSYMVLGWYSKKEKDILASLTKENWKKMLDRFLLRLPSGQYDDFANQSLLHSVSFGLKWPTDNSQFSGMPNGQVDVSIGNSSIEALSALVAAKLKEQGDADINTERLLNILQYDLMEELEQKDAVFAVENGIHGKGFCASTQEKHWIVRQSNNGDAVTDGYPDNTGHLLNNLNLAQSQQQRVERAYKDSIQKLYRCWFTYKTKEPFVKQDYPQAADILKEADRLSLEIDALKQEITDLQATVLQAKKKLEDCLLSAGGSFVLEVIHNNYYQPCEPVVLFSGSGIKRSYDFGETGRFSDDNTTLLCRINSQTTQGFSVAALEKSFKLDCQQLLSFCSKREDGFIEKESKIHPDFAKLLAEAIFLNEANASLLAEACFSARGETPPQSQIDKLSGAIKTAISTKNLLGTLPSPIAVNYWQPPWNSLFLEWDVGYYPTKSKNDKTWIDNWSHKDVDYDYSLPIAAKQVSFTGRTIVTPHSQAIFRQAVEKCAKLFDGDKELQKKLVEFSKALTNMNILSQSLGGFNNFLGGTELTLQLPVQNARTPDAGLKRLTQIVNNSLDNENRLGLKHNAGFYPVRAGFLKVNSFRIISSFGISQTFSPKNTYISETLRSALVDNQNAAMLTPRYIEPLSLSFSWRDHTGMLPYANTQSPIAGFIISNRLNKGLMVFNNTGQFLGHLRLFYDKTKTSAQWFSDYTLQSLPLRLQKFLNGILSFNNSPREVYKDFLDVIDTSLAKNFSDGYTHSQNLSVLTGRPIAIASANIRLAKKNSLGYSHNYADFAHYDTHGAEKTKFEVRLGSFNNPNDGVLGYFVDKGQQLYQEFYTNYNLQAPANDDAEYIKYGQNALISIEDAQGLDVTLLVEPMSKVNIATGILPNLVSELPYEHCRKALEQAELRFEVYPLITRHWEISLPLPAAQWQWLYKQGDTEIRSNIIAPDSASHFEKMSIIDGNLIKKGWK